MNSEFPRYGESDLGGAYYLIREVASSVGRIGTDGVAICHIDGLGDFERVGTAAHGSWAQEAIARLPTLDEARAQHLAPAFAEAEVNARKWAEEQERSGRNFDAPAPDPISPATERFLYSDDEPGWDLNL